MDRIKYTLNEWIRLNLILLVALFIIRLVFHVYNADLLAAGSLWAWIRVYGLGIQYDLMILLPVTAILLPVLWYSFKPLRQGYPVWASLLATLGIAPLMIISIADIPYYRFNSRRATVEVFQLMNDSLSAFPSFFVRYILFVLLLFLLVFLVVYIFRRSHTTRLSALWSIVISLLLLVLATNFGRILTPKNASFYIEPEYVPIAVNTPMTLGYSILKGQEVLEAKQYFESEEELGTQFNVMHQLKSDTAFTPKNIVLFLMESVSREYLIDGHANEAELPFLRSIMDQSLVFTNAFANGTTSSYGLMSILGGIPPFLDEPYFSSIYGDNKLLGIGSLLQERGYSSAFFYGAETDHYGFRKNLSLLGIQEYFSMEDYPGDAYDGNWGLYDEPFLDYTAKKLKSIPQPFFISHFNISTHFPYMVPENLKEVLPVGRLASHQSLAYYDQALQTFFNSIRSEPWYTETIFVFISDHWAKMREMEDKSNVGIYRIPFFIYDPSHPIGRKFNEVAQQVDVIPTLLDYLNYGGPWMSFGSSLLEERPYRFTYNEFEDIYRIIDSSFVLAYDENRDRSFSLHDYHADPELKENLIDVHPARAAQMERRLQAVIQTYNNRLLTNTLYPLQDDLINLGH